MSRGIEEMEAAGGNAGGNKISAMHCENFATIEKIYNPCEIFAMHIF